MAVDRESSYANPVCAQTYTQRTVDRNLLRIQRWLASDTTSRLALTSFFSGETTGRMQAAAMLYAGRGAYDVSATRVILQRQDASPGFRVYSTYPADPWSTPQPGWSGPDPAAPRSVDPVIWYGKYAVLADLLDAYAGQAADDAPGRPGTALTAYLAAEGAADPARPVLAAAQARQLVHDGILDPGAITALQILPRPLEHAAEPDFFAWLTLVAQLCEQAAAQAYPAPTPVPQTGWEWRRTFPELHQLLAGYYGQDFDGEFGPGPASHRSEVPADDMFGAQHAGALAAWAATASPAATARLLGESVWLARLDVGRPALTIGLTELGLCAQLQTPPQAWLELLAGQAGGYAGFTVRAGGAAAAAVRTPGAS
jgi:hypothetical protein